ncbi:MAG TPA: LysR family transcriptional regulator [Alphaproteobacteria bacterium]|nr:LysR family transcriptional regulator [Alphaproteobacteria bacterium]
MKDGLHPRQVEAFDAVVQTGSFTEAARLLKITQPAVTRLVRSLEETMGFKLLERGAGGARPTRDGALFHRHVEQYLLAFRQLSLVAERIRSGQEGALQVAAIPALATTIVPRAVARFQKTHPGALVRIIDGASHEVAEYVGTGVCELGFATAIAQHPNVTCHALPRVRTVAIVPKGHPLAARAEIRPADLHGQTLVAFRTGTAAREQLDAVLKAARAKPRLVLETSLASVAAACAASGVGIAVLDALTAEAVKGEGAVVLPCTSGADAAYALLVPKHRALSAAARTFATEAAAVMGGKLKLR